MRWSFLILSACELTLPVEDLVALDCRAQEVRILQPIFILIPSALVGTNTSEVRFWLRITVYLI